MTHQRTADAKRTSAVRVLWLRLEGAGDLPLPARATPGAAGIDLRSAVHGTVEVAPGERVSVATGFAVAIPRGFEGQVRPRSGLALKQGMTVLNAPGTVDSDYRGEILVILINHGAEPVRIHRGDRIAQLVIAPVARAESVEVDVLDETERGAEGFGSTGR
ncbi:MAG: deoxyuridine 5'-triphosphate nucleotidohydrolase [bacterium TMED88]|nr:dUTP diphosphatase [Deltaproteobacteria bacterium]OUV21638.1 MAG: deoxyuridine 5'-triphosphate nucleotidohydrolase [bacterium TMED88]